MGAAETANAIAGWALGVAIVAVVVAVLAGVFTAWQAITAHMARRADNEGSLVEWAPVEWVAAEAVDIRSNGPDIAYRVWARVNIDGGRYECNARRMMPGDSLHFEIDGQEALWSWFEDQSPRRGEQTISSTAFYYGGLITWHSRYGRRFSLPLEGSISRRLRFNADPYRGAE